MPSPSVSPVPSTVSGIPSLSSSKSIASGIPSPSLSLHVGSESTTTLELARDSQPAAFVSVNVYVAPAASVTTPLPSTVGPVGVKV